MAHGTFDLECDRLIWLSHTLSVEAPAYGGGISMEILPVKRINNGDSSNSVIIKLPNHLGSHVDAPRHFLEEGKTIEEYTPGEWFFLTPLLVDLVVSNDEIINADTIEATGYEAQDADIVLCRTRCEVYRDRTRYWQHNPGFAPEVAEYLKNSFTSIRAIGMDTISLSGFQHRELGRRAHREFLRRDIRIFEDMRLSSIPVGSQLDWVLAFPLRFEQADGAPCSIIGYLRDKPSGLM